MLLTLIIPGAVSGKNIVIKGTIVNSKTNIPVAYVNVAVEGTYYGSVSNEKGDFKLVVPDELNLKSVSFSAIGFERRSVPINEIKGNLAINLTPADYQIGEIIVMPDSTLRTLLKRAYEKIPENYPDFPTRSNGFYRECVKQENADYLYISEAVLDVYKTSFKNEESGQVKILKSRKKIAPGSDTINPVQFYGGIFTPHSFDLVKKHSSLLKPSKKYRYSMKNSQTYNGQEVYCIAFSPKNGNREGITGEFFLDKESLAYLKFEYCSNDERIKENEKEIPLNGIVFLDNRRIINYEKIEGKYYMKSAFLKQKMLNKKTGYSLNSTIEYIQTMLTIDDARPIPYDEQLTLSTVISEKAEEYETSNWKDYTILENESVQTAFVSMQQADSLLNKSTPPSKRQVFEKIFKILSHFEAEINITAHPVSISQGNYLLHLSLPDKRQLNFTTDTDNDLISLHLETAFKYRITKYWKIFYLESDNLLPSEKSKVYYGGIEYEIPLKTYGKKIFCSANAGYGYMEFLKSMGEVENTAEFTFNGKNFDSNKIEAYRGIQLHGPRLGADLSFQVSNFWYLKLYGGWQFNLNQTEKIRIEEKDGFFLSRKSDEFFLTDAATNFYFNGEATASTQFDYKNYIVGIGLKYAF